jgi:hypothetical protein
LGGYFEFPYLNPERDKDDDVHPKDKPNCKDVGRCDADAKVEKSFGGIPKNLLIYGPNGTSNTIAQQILDGAGIPYRLPNCAWAAGYSGHLPSLPPIHIPGLPPIPRQW